MKLNWERTRDARPRESPARGSFQERSAGLEPTIPAWQASTLPLRHERSIEVEIVKDQKSKHRLVFCFL